MPWGEVSTVSLRREFVRFASSDCVNVSELCRRYGISRKTGYKWLSRYGADGPGGLLDRSRRPHHSPDRLPNRMETRILAIRDAHPKWGGRKIRRRLQDLGTASVPAASTITEVLRRHNRLDPVESEKRQGSPE